MLKKTISYTDYDGNERTEDFYFNLTEAEILEMNLSASGGLEKLIQRIVSEQNGEQIVKMFKEIILKSYGEKSLDGRRFVKNSELTEAFTQTEAYSKLFVELASDSDKAAEFVNGIIPKDKEGNDKNVGSSNITSLPVNNG